MFLRTVFALVVFSFAAYAREKPARTTAIPYTITTSTLLANADPASIALLTKSVENALSIVESFPPKTDNFFIWKGDKTILNGKSLKIFLTLKKLQGMTLADRQAFQVKSSQEGVDFLVRLQKSEYHGKLSEEVQADFVGALEREKAMLDSWKK
jgi:hypothetical protein